MKSEIKDGMLLRVLLLIFCAWLWILGAAVVAPIAYYVIAFKDFFTFLGTETYFHVLYIVSPVLIGITVLIILTASIIGCCSAALYNRCLLTTFNVIMVLSVLLHVAGAGVFLALHDEISTKMTDSMKSYMQNASPDEVALTFESIQNGLKCCGTESPNDWYTIKAQIPSSCCIDQGCVPIASNVHKTGCAYHLKTNFQWISILSMVVAVIVTCMEIFGIILSYILICKPRYVVAQPI
ncbi:hypothetical protein LOD99_2628 [Oopsacas minuta]|uniref:Tetraspanin n=1 Tax=Oopsacas minuta TaxID=111878 RepID=A0AAV7K0J5_9METZ|nr:hypothetical protein LOD99_2628 [Oopsacas minuta]